MLAILQLNHAKNHFNGWLGMALITVTNKATDMALFMAKLCVNHKDLHQRIRTKICTKEFATNRENNSDSPKFWANRGKYIVCKKCTAPTQTTESPVYRVFI